MATITRFEDLEIWQLARELSKLIYQLTFTEPLRSDFRLKDQMLGSVGSIMDNVAEGFEGAASTNSSIHSVLQRGKQAN